MLTAKRSFFLLFCALSFTISALADDVPINDFEIGTQKELSLKRNAFAYFKFRITEITPKYDLSVIAHPRGDNDPELFLATGNQYPSKRDDSEYFSTSVGYSSIYIPSADIKLNTDYYLGVSCASEVCDFNLTVDYAQEYYMREYIEDVIIDYVDGGTVVARVYIPPRATIHHILFAAEVESQVESDQSLHMYVNKGNEIPTSSKSDIVALAAWKDGKAAIIYSDDQQRFCTNCNYTIVIEAPRKSKVIFRRTLYGDQIPFDLNDERNDAVELGSNVTYAVNISQFDVDVSFIIVEVIPYFGKTKVLANLGTLPTKYEDYAFNLSGWGQELLFIPVQAKPANNLLYVTVDGTTYSTYSIRIYSMNKKNMVLKLGEPEVGYILNEEVENFLLTAVGRKNMKMTFSLHPDQGKVNLFVKTCDEKANCQFTKDETQSILNGTTPTSIKTPILQYANITAGDDSIEFDMDGSVCEASSNRGAPICYFAVAVLGASPGSSKFTLTASRADLPQALRVSRTVKEHLSVDQYKYYYFTITDDTNIESVNFQITKISGSVDIYISRKTKYPDSRDKEEFHHYNDLYSFERSHFPVLNGTYYIAIKGFTSATYSIVPIVRYNTTGDDLGGHHLIKLREGVPQKIVIDNLEPAYFKFEAAVADVQAQGLEVSLDEVQGHFVICAGTGPELPAIGRCQFESNTTTLVIEKGSIGTLNQGDAHFDPMATYLVAVFPKTIKQTDDDDDDAKPIKPKVQSFSITWAGLHTYRTISFGIPWTNSIKKDRVIYYKIEAHPGEDKEIVIHRTTDASSPSLYTVTLYLANRETKLGHNVSVFSPDRTLTTGDTLKLKEADINSLCEDTEGNKCYLFLAAATDSDSEVSYTLTITKDFDDLRISESVQATYTFPSKGHPIHLYYYPHRLEDITILSHTYGRNITLFANVINTRDHSSRSGWIFPTNRTYEFISKSSVAHAGESRLFIPAGELSSCGADYDKFRCGIALTLYYDVPQDVDDFFKDFALFSIMANQEVTPIAAGKPIHTSVNEGTYAYFSLYVNKDEATLLISANVLSGKHVVILASKGRDARPTMDNAEFRSYYGKMETLQVSGDQTVGGTAKGYWVIAVYGYSETEFVLTVLFEKTKMVELHRGLPLNLDVTTDPVYFEYYHESNSSFTFKFAKERGNGRISIKTFKEGEAVADGLPTEFRGDIVRPFEYFQNVIEVSNRSEAFCSKCMYVVGIFPRSEMKISVVAQLPGQFIFLQDNMIFTDSASSTTFNKYEYISYPDATLDINLVVYSGEPHIYVSHNPTVNNTHYLWKYTDISTNNYVRMRLDNTPYSTQSSLDPVFDGTKNVTTFKNVYFIMITAPINTNYSIAVSISNSTRVLVDGHLDFGFLNPGEFNLYKYHVSKDDIADNSTNRLKLQFTLHKDKFTATLREELTRPDIVVMSVPHKSYNNASINPYSLMPDLPVLTPIRDDELGKAFGDQHYTLNLQYVAAADQDFYIVVNNTKSEKHLNYSIVANSHEPLFLTMNNFHAARTAVGESEIYAVHADNKGLLVIEIHECMGRVSVQTSNTRNFVNAPIEAIDDTTQDSNGPAVDDETFNDDAKGKNAPVLNELTDSSMGSQIKLASINIEQEQTVYIIVTATEGLRDDDNIDEKEAVYKIRVNLHPLRNFMPFKSLSPGMEGAVTWDIPSSGKVKLGFSDVQNTAVVDKAIKTAKFGNLNITYKYEAFVTKHPVTGKFMARCDMLPKKQGYFKSIDLYQKTVAFDRESLTTDPNDESMKYVELDVEPTYQTQYATIRVTALGVDSNGNAVWDYPIIYKTTEFKSGTTILGVGSQTFLVVLLIVCVIMLIAAVIGLYYYYNKFQRVKAKLNYEMQDLRNMTNVVESFDMLDDDRGHTKAGYSGLMEDNNM